MSRPDPDQIFAALRKSLPYILALALMTGLWLGRLAVLLACRWACSP
jgi:hypothetical protein